MMHEGRFLVTGKLDEIKKSMNGTVVEIVCDNIRTAYNILKDNEMVLESQTFGDRLNVVIKNEDNIPELKKLLESNKIMIGDIRIISPSLENVFISLLEKTEKG